MTAAPAPVRAARPVRRRVWPWVIAGLLLAGGVGGVLYVRHTRAQASASAAPTTTTQAAQPGTVRVSVSGPGTLEAGATRTVGADLTATVGALPAVGERVTRGQLLTTLSSSDVAQNVQTARLNLQKAQATLDAGRASQASGAANRQSSVTQAAGSVTQAQATLSDAERALSAQRQLSAIGAASTQAVADAQSAVTKAALSLQSAQASLSSARTQAQTGASSDTQTLRGNEIAVQQARQSLQTAEDAQAKLKVYAPITGVVSTVSATQGTVVTSGASILTVIDDSVLALPVQVDETQISGVGVGQTAEVTLDAFADQTFSGKVTRVSPGATQSSGISVFTATVELPNADHRLRSGMTAEAEIIQSEDRGLLVPSKAIQTVRSRSYVEVPAEDGAEPERVRVQTGATDGTNTVITGGLESGQEVIVPGSARRASSGTSSSGARQSQSGGQGGPPGGGFGGGLP